MEITDLTEAQTANTAVEGTVNRIVLKLQAGADEDCRDIRVVLKCINSRKPLSESPGEPSPANVVDFNEAPIFVRRSQRRATADVAGSVVLPVGWALREDVSNDVSQGVASSLAPLLGAGQSLLMPLEIFCPLDRQPGEARTTFRSTSYEVLILYKKLHPGGNAGAGDEVTVVRNGCIDWITPFSARFFPQPSGPRKAFPGGILHASNLVSGGSATSSGELVAANNEIVRIRCVLETNGLGTNVAAKVKSVSDGNEVLYSSSSSNIIMHQPRLGTKLSLSYSVTLQKHAAASGNMAPLGTVSVDWTPASLALHTDLDSTDASALNGNLVHGPLALEKMVPLTFQGPLCRIMDAPFSVKLSQRPSLPKVCSPFCIKYRVTNNTAKSQSLKLAMNSDADETAPQFLASGKMKEHLELAPFEERTLNFTLMSMLAGEILRPAMTLTSDRYQTWVVNETPTKSRYLFVMP